MKKQNYVAKPMIQIDEKGWSVQKDMDPDEVAVLLAITLVEYWDTNISPLNGEDAINRVIQTMHDAEDREMLHFLMDQIMGDDCDCICYDNTEDEDDDE